MTGRTCEPLGDQAVLVTTASPADAVALAAAVRAANRPGVVDVVPAYAAVGVYLDPDVADLAATLAWLTSLHAEPRPATAGTLHVIPVDYTQGPDLDHVARVTGLDADEVVRLHTSCEYTAFAVGFAPGFAYLGPLPPALCGVPRLATPRVRVPAGSVGLTGDQTGVYPLDRPGGWPLIGRTPRVLVDVAAGYFPLAVGDRVRFVAG